ncbi:hypothetical protein BGZ76_007301 [Entomortierella beljakovae]|nr:hypothetical protein BGZ76_007301 [Entomortierella beljakovae]
MSIAQENQVRNGNFFDMPEMLDQIAKYINTNDLAVCVRVSRDWHRVFIPFLWEYTGFYGNEYAPTASTLSKYANLIRSLRINGEIPSYVLTTSLPCLQKLYHFRSYPTKCTFSPLLLSNNPTIEEISMSGGINIPKNPKFWKTLSNLQNLKSIDINFAHVYPEDLEAFWDTFCRLESATFCNIFLPVKFDDSSKKPLKLKHLTITGSKYAHRHQMFIEAFTGLETLHWSAHRILARAPRASAHVIENFVNCFKRVTWPNIHQVVLNSIELNNIDLQQILSSISRLTAFSANKVIWGTESFIALSDHFDTLESFGSPEVHSFTSVMVNTVMCSCQNLKELQAVVIDGVDILNDKQMDSKGQRGQGWMCKKLTTLAVRFNLLGLDSQIYILERLSSLVHLSKLDMRGFNPIEDSTIKLSLVDGLYILKPLMKLSYIHITGNRHSMTEEDIEWILKNWRKLINLNGELHYDWGCCQSLRQKLKLGGVSFW